MTPHRLLVVLATGLALLASVAVGGPARTNADELLRIESAVTYEILPEQGPVRVTWQIALDNNDPSTERDDSGNVQFYESLTIPILTGASAVEARGPGGVDLDVQVDGSPGGPVAGAEVDFDRDLYYEDTYELELTYEIADTRSSVLLVSDNYVFLPAISSGDASEVQIVATDAAEWDVTIEPIDCPLVANGIFSCGPSEFVEVAALVEVARAGVLTASTFDVPMRSGPVAITLRHFPGEEAWAARMREIADAAIPLLEDLFGVAYDGPRLLEVAERGRQEIAGYEGTFSCGTDACVIGISPLAEDIVAVHEFAHLWTEAFENRWIAEGLAEFVSKRAAESLTGTVAPYEFTRPDRVLDFPLDEWGRSHYLIGATQDELEVEASGYYRSRLFFEDLEGEIGLQAIQAANQAAAEQGAAVDTEDYFGMLEEASGRRLDDLFLGAVFPESYAPRLEQRADLIGRLGALRTGTDEAGFSLPARIGQLLDEWDFDEAETLIVSAERALAAYIEAEARLDESRSFTERIGLIGKDPDATLEDAADAFTATEFSRSERLSRDAIAEMDSAADDGLIRLLIAAGIAALLLVGVVVVVWIVRAAASGPTYQ